MVLLISSLILIEVIHSSVIEYGRTIEDGRLSDSSHSWAGFRERCDGNLVLNFDLSNLTGGVQANLNLNATRRYAIGFINMGNGSLFPYLYREENESIVHFPGQPMDYDPLAVYHVEISSAEGRVEVKVRDAKQGEGYNVIDYQDADPLPTGGIDFETLENSSAKLQNITLNCEVGEEGEEPPDLGVGYFKPP